ncbi:MAG: hypothetical protein KF708_17865 [Pirellulales bacterium]|nr:hypothetical protein [Pirellulales bacterium]
MSTKGSQRGKRIVFAIVAVAVGLVFLEGLLSILWMVPDFLARRRSAARAITYLEDYHARHNSELGWEHIPGKTVSHLYGKGRSITINADGFRGREDYVGHKPSDRFRVVCLGDSMTMGYGVDDPDTYPAQLEQVNPRIQAVNMGQGGYSVGQDYLWFKREHARLEPDLLVASFIVDDFWRLVNMRTPNGAAVPHFNLIDGRVVVSNQPVPPKIETGDVVDPSARPLGFLFEKSALFRTVDTVVKPAREVRVQVDRNEQFQLALAILAELKREAGDVPLVLVMLPEVGELKEPARLVLYRQIIAELERFAQTQGIPLLDLSGDFLAAGNIDRFFLTEKYHHFSEAGNRLIAERLNAFLGDKVPGYPRATN